MKIYISLPITGHNLEGCRERAIKGKEMVERLGHTAVTPFDVCPQEGLPYSAYIGRDIEALLQCDAIFLLAGWSGSRGCQAEWRVAQIYDKRIFTHISQIAQ